MPQNEKIIIAIDGPAGAGKSTIAKLIAKKLDFFYIDTGAMYRALTLKAKQKNLKLDDESQMIVLAKCTRIQLDYKNGNLNVLLDGKDVSEEIRTPYVTDGVSTIAKIKAVREVMTHLQRKIAHNNNCVLEGRDIGTVVFPNAKFKFFLDADFNERANRRFKELKEKNLNIDIYGVEEDLSSRDRMDSTRKVAPLKKADDAIYIDTTNLTIEGVVSQVLKWIKI